MGEPVPKRLSDVELKSLHFWNKDVCINCADGMKKLLSHIAALDAEVERLEAQNNQLHDEVGQRGDALGERNTERRMLREDEAESTQEIARLQAELADAKEQLSYCPHPGAHREYNDG